MDAPRWNEIEGEDIGHDVRIRYYEKLDPQTGERRKAGILVYHLHSDGVVCGGTVPFDVPVNSWEKHHGRPCWTVKSWRPLTIEPSILDPSCAENFHGYITNGHWDPC